MFVYWLKSGKRDYIGFTINLEKRLRQHNSGRGAKRTRGAQWTIHRLFPFTCKMTALRFEFALKIKRDKEKSLPDLLRRFDLA